MNNFIRAFLLFICFSILSITNAEAQFFKKLFGGGKKDQTPHAKVDTVNRKGVTEITVPSKPKKFVYPKSVLKDKYRIDILMPLYLDEAVVDYKVIYKTKLPAKIIPSLYFYEGVSLALDTLKRKGYKVDIHVHDIANPYNTPELLIRTGVMDGTDLIIGAVQSSDIPEIADFAKNNEVNFISALSPSDADVSNNPFFVMIQPTLEVHCKEIGNKIYQKYGNVTPLMLYRDNNDFDMGAYDYITKEQKYSYEKFSCNNFPTKADLEKYFTPNGRNIVVMPIINNKYANSLLNAIEQWFPTYSFDVWGMPSWKTMASLNDPDAYPNIAIYITHPFYFDYTTGYGKALAEKYGKQYGDETPHELVYRGYEITLWYIDLLNKYGKVFNSNINYGLTPFTRYNVKTISDENGGIKYLQNQHLYLFRYQSSSYIVVY